MATNTSDFFTYSATAGTAKNLQKPQDGGDNNQWGNYINTDLDEIVAAVNALSDKIADANEKTLVDFTATGSAVNHVGITNAATGNGPTISTAGTDSNVDLNVTPKGTGDSVFTNKIKVDDVIEKTTDHGVEIEGVLVKDSIVKADDIQEKTTDHGVEIEGVLVKDSIVQTDDIQEKTSDHGVEIDGVTLKDGAGTFTGEITVTNKLNSSAGNSLTLQSPSGGAVIINTNGSTERVRITSAGSITTPNSSFDGTIGSSATFPNGHVIQVVSNSFATETFTQSMSFQPTGISVDITPRTTSSKFFIITNTTGYNNEGHTHVGYYTIYRDSTDLGASGFAGFANPYLGVTGGADLGSSICISTLDSPSSLSTSTAITYEMRVRVNNTANKSYWSMNNSESSITVMEIAQ